MKNIAKLNPKKSIYYAKPGDSLMFSIYNAWKIIKENGFSDDDVVLIYNAVRLVASHELIALCYYGCKDAVGVMPVIPIKDTTYLREVGKHIQSLHSRSHLWNFA